MTDKDQARAFSAELDKLINRFRKKFNLSYAAAVGVLVIKANALCRELADEPK